MFSDPLAHLSAELQRLDLLLHREILRLRAAYQLSLDEFRGLYISDEQVDALIDHSEQHDLEIPLTQTLTERAEALRRANAEQVGTELPWHRVVSEFALSDFEQDVLLLALAPEIDLKYETLFAYLNNDVTRKRPTFDLALRLCAPERAERLRWRRCLLPRAPLFQSGLLQLTASSEPPTWLSSGFVLAPPVLNFLLDPIPVRSEAVSPVRHRPPVPNWDEVPLSVERRAELCRLVARFQNAPSDRPLPALVFEGQKGSGRARAAEAFCQELGLTFLQMDPEIFHNATEPPDRIAQHLLLQQRLLGAGLYVEATDALLDKEGRPLPGASRFVRALAQGGGLLVLACASASAWNEAFSGRRVLVFSFFEPDFALRARLWELALIRAGLALPIAEIETLADRFLLTPRQIGDAVTQAAEGLDARYATEKDYLLTTLREAARAHSGQSLQNLAVKVALKHDWNDLVLPRPTLKRVKEVCAAVRYRHIVYSRWGFERRIASGKGLKVLFAGASGTGKTMTAGVIARDLGVDLYKIDLSSVVSKYIGETEKNLETIFRAAHSSNAILFFDEADALFGKRSEVKDAHDRYANIEVAYLLQRMEEHEGVVILASNLSKNIDEAFTRRMHYIVEFPLPDEVHREQLWRGMFPDEVPLGKDVDFPFLARQFTLAGGDIRNVALDAAFLAVQEEQRITMKQLIKALARQMVKQGRIPSTSDFKQYHALIAQDE